MQLIYRGQFYYVSLPTVNPVTTDKKLMYLGKPCALTRFIVAAQRTLNEELHYRGVRYSG